MSFGTNNAAQTFYMYDFFKRLKLVIHCDQINFEVDE